MHWSDWRWGLLLILAAQIITILLLAGCIATQTGFDWKNANYGITGHEEDSYYDYSRK